VLLAAMSTNDAVFHRRNKQIEDAIDVGNLKQALQLIEKRIKKGEDTSFLKVCAGSLSYSKTAFLRVVISRFI
jgi:N-terminal acetyltransferase B complex non-catalytic subunit